MLYLFDVAKFENFKNMFVLVAKDGIEFQLVSYSEVRMKYLKQQVEILNIWRSLETFRGKQDAP